MSAHRKEYCIKGHRGIPENLTSARNCKICQKDRVGQFLAANPQKYREKENARNKGYRDQLTDSYLNVLVHAKTGIPYDQITADDRADRRRIVLDYRKRKALKGASK